MTKQLIVNADDLALSVATNLAILESHTRGVVTSASLMANMAALDHAVEQVLRPNPRLGAGIHLCLTSGRPVLTASAVPLLVDGGGRFRHGFVGLIRLLRSRHGDDALAEIAREWQAQAARLDACGIALDHLDSHHHVHVIPELYPIAAEIAARRGLAVRLPHETLELSWSSLVRLPRRLARGNVLKKMILSRFARQARRAGFPAFHADHYFGVLDTGAMTRNAWQSLLSSLRDGVTEVNLHPGDPSRLESGVQCSHQDLLAIRSVNRAAELRALLDPALREELVRRDVRLARFADCRAGVVARVG